MPLHHHFMGYYISLGEFASPGAFAAIQQSCAQIRPINTPAGGQPPLHRSALMPISLQSEPKELTQTRSGGNYHPGQVRRPWQRSPGAIRHIQ